MTGTCNILLNSKGDGGQAVLVTDLRGNASSLSPLSMTLAIGLLYIDSTRVRNFSFISTCYSDLIRKNVGSCQRTSLHLVR